MIDFVNEIRRRNLLLYRLGVFNLLLLALAFAMFFIDDTIITGANAWIKPMKFSLSIVIYVWTFAWLLHYLPNEKSRIFISRVVTLCMVVENVLIYFQAARGIRSHFNVTSALNAAIFSTMGIFIMINTIIVLYTTILFFSPKIQLEKSQLWAWRIALIFFFVGAASGGIMAAILHHTIGAEDGGPGIPFLNWSTVAGDIRSAHFITLHGLQAIPIATLLFTKITKVNSQKFVFAFSLLYLALCAWFHWLAFMGIPVLRS